VQAAIAEVASEAMQTGATAGGDLSGTYPNPTVAKVNGIAVSGTPAVGNVLVATSATAGIWMASKNYRAAVLDTAPVGYWRLGEASGTTAVDEMAANAGAYVGAPTLGVTGLLTGDLNTAVTLNGTTQYVSAGVAGMPAGATLRTIAAWINPSTYSGTTGGTIFGLNAASAQKFYVQCRTNTGTTLLFTDGVNVANNVSLTGAQIPPAGSASFVAFVLTSPTTYQYYLNGVLTLSGTFGVAINTDPLTSVTIGERLDSSQPFAGTLDEPTIWNRALSADEVAKLYAAGAAALQSLQTSLLTAKGALVTATAASTPATQLVGADAQVLTADSTQANGIKWANAASGFANPMTTAGDIITGGTAGAAQRLAAGTASQVLTVVSGAPAWAAAAAGSSAFVGVKAYSAALQSIPVSTFTAVAFELEEYDTSAFHDLVTNNTRLTIPAGKAGYYLLTGFVNFTIDATASFYLEFFQNGVTDLRAASTGIYGANPGVVNSTTVLLAAGDYVELRVWHNSAAARNIGNTTTAYNQNFFACSLLGT